MIRKSSTLSTRNILRHKNHFHYFRAFRFLEQKLGSQKSPIFVSLEIAKVGSKLLTFVKMARNADLDFAEK